MVGGGVGRLLTFSAFRMGADSRLGAYSNKYRITILLGYPAGACAEESASMTTVLSWTRVQR